MIRLLLFLVTITFVLTFRFDSSSRKALGDTINGTEVDMFERFTAKWSKNYKDLDEVKRKAANWKRNRKLIEDENNKGLSYKLTENFFTDMDDEEKSKYGMKIETLEGAQAKLGQTGKRFKRGAQTTSSNPKCDWRGPLMPPIKNQGPCGSCYVFAAINAIEVQWNSIPGHAYTAFSEQQIVDHYNPGCNAGWPSGAWEVSMGYGNTLESEYPYTGTEGDIRNDTTRLQVVNNYYRLSSIEDMEYYLCNVGPFTVCLYLEHTFYSYYEGIYFPPTCPNEYGLHCVSVVGFGTDETGQDYWIVRNSWGSGWGEGGYIKIAKGHNICLIETYDVYLPWVNGQAA